MSDAEEEIISEDDSAEGLGTVKRLRERLEKAIAEKQEYLEGWQRARADFANFKRQETVIHADREGRIRSDVIEQLLPGLDALELALKHQTTKELSLIESQFLKALQRIGIERYGSVGEVFDPHLHEALAQRSDEHKIISIERSGYKAGDKIIRPAQVII